MITHFEGRGGQPQLFDSCVIIQIDEINEVSDKDYNARISFGTEYSIFYRANKVG